MKSIKELLEAEYIGKELIVYKTTFPNGIEWKEVKLHNITNSHKNKVEQCGMKVVDIGEVEHFSGVDYCLIFENDFYLYLN